MSSFTKEIRPPEGLQVEHLLPHRPPMRFVDTILQVSLEIPLSIVTTKQIREDEFFFQGHYPGRPIVPGALILEGLAQTGLLLFQLSGREVQADEIPVLASIEGRFLNPVFPEDVLVYRVEMDKRIELAAIFHGTASVKEMVVAKGEFSFGVKAWRALKSR